MALDPVPTYPGNYDANELNNSPAGTETRREGDDHIRRMKASEKATWTNVTGAVTASHTEINTLSGISTTDPIITLPSGTKMLFYQDTAPSGWTIDAVPDNTMVRITQGLAGGGVTGGTITGANNFSDQFAAHAEDATLGVRNHTLVEGEIPQHDHGGGNHSHSFEPRLSAGGETCLDMTANSTPAASVLVAQPGSGIIINDYGGASPAHAHTIDQNAKASACIIATKD